MEQIISIKSAIRLLLQILLNTDIAAKVVYRTIPEPSQKAPNEDHPCIISSDLTQKAPDEEAPWIISSDLIRRYFQMKYNYQNMI